jgi:hypothetical protein
MYEVIILFFLFIILFLIFNKKQNNNDELNDKSYDTEDIKDTEDTEDISDNKSNEKIIILKRGDTPALRGYIDFYNMDTIKEEGGSKVFNHIIKDNNNLKANVVNYKNYESYRKKPFTIKRL